MRIGLATKMLCLACSSVCSCPLSDKGLVGVLSVSGEVDLRDNYSLCREVAYE